MKDFLIGVGIGFAVGAIMCKTYRPLADAVQKGKKMVEEKLDQGKDLVKDKAKELSDTQSKNPKQAKS